MPFRLNCAAMLALCIGQLMACGGGTTAKTGDVQEPAGAAAAAAPKTCENGLNGAMETCVANKPAAASSDNTM